MGKSASTATPSTSRGYTAIASLNDAEKTRLFDHLQTVHANVAASSPNPSNSQPDAGTEQTIYFSNVYSAVAQSKIQHAINDDMVLDTGADEFIFHSSERFINMVPINPISSKTADGSCHLQATHQGDAVVESFDDEGLSHKMIMPGSLYCKDISVNLISAIRLCDAGCTFNGNSTVITFNHPNGGQLHARRQSQSSELWTVRPKASSTCLSVSADIMHQRLGHLHSAALRRFCNGGKSTTICTSCILAKSHRHPF